jgi:hypothetical protein
VEFGDLVDDRLNLLHAREERRAVVREKKGKQKKGETGREQGGSAREKEVAVFQMSKSGKTRAQNSYAWGA